MEISVTAKVNNVPETAKDYEYIIVRSVDGRLWYYGAGNDEKEVDRVAGEVGGFVLKWR